VTVTQEPLLVKLGFRFGINGPHAARTMMLDDLRALLSHTPADAIRADYARAIVDDNVLGKSTKSARQLAWRHLGTLYGCGTNNPIFRALRRLWPLDEAAQPMLALAAALARDPLLRGTQSFIVNQVPGTQVTREQTEAFLDRRHPQRFTPASLKSFAQNVAGTWTAAGLLAGHRRKLRSLPARRPESLALLLFLAYLEGRTGQRLFTSDWTSLMGGSPDELEALANSASHRGLLVFMNAGGVKEVRFPGYLTPEEERIREEASRVH
jgi:hypothetical protein